MSIKRYTQIAKMFFQGNWPSYLIFFVTSRCNARCKMCFNWENIGDCANRHELTLGEIGQISRGLKDVTYLTISGGEPTLRNDLPEIIKIFARGNNLQFVTLPTNGVLPQRISGTIDKILFENSNVSFRIVLPLDGIGQLHDEIRGVKSNFDSFLETYHKLHQMRSKYNNFDIDVATVLSSFNKNKIGEIINFVENELQIDNHVLALARGNTRLPEAKGYSIEDAENSIRLFEERALRNPYQRNDSGRDIIKALKLTMRDVVLKTAKKKQAVIPCLAGRKLIMIDDVGNLYPCELLNKKLANLREINFDMRKALFSNEANRIKKWIIQTKCFCTFECAMQASVAFNLRLIPRIFLKLLKIKMFPRYTKNI